ncbi:hypothetical protein A7D00_2258 [Trichophyton violaceum]|uniref:FHA domain-containing protein n=1 Tax=Trichophyton violaceum TaxID=34388 RepID=A0A178FQK7_TRIVO|nr:hypothetical protein A7D00_2258 [Trichophyton violaceum]
MELVFNAFAAWKSKVHQLLAGSSSREGLYIHPLECLGTRKAINLIDTDLGLHLHIPVRVEDAPKPAAPSHRDTGLQAPTVGNAPEAPEDGNHVVIGAGRRSDKPLPSQQDAFSKTPRDGSGQATPVGEKEKEKANYGNTGRLAADTNTVRSSDGTTSVVLKYNEPPEARKPPAKDAWRLYIFKDDNLLETIELGDRSCWLIGKEKLVADLPIDHPSCSKQHATIQFRYVEKRNDFGDRDGRVRPYLIDLESANGTTVNGDPAPARRYMELMDKDVLKFGLSTREYVLLLPPS